MLSQIPLTSFRGMQLIMLLVCALLISLGSWWWMGESHECWRFSVMPFIVNPYGDPRNVSYLPNLALLKWPKPYVASYPAGSRGPNGKIRPLPGALEPVMSLGQRRLSKTLLRVFSNMMFANGMGDRFFLAGGTLVGTFLFHDMVPWDDDVDVFVDIGLRNKIQRLLGKLPRPYQWYPQKQRDKLYTSVLPEKYNKMDVELSRRPFKYPWAWPFLDICYFKSNGTHFWESNIGANNPIYIPLSVIFPTYFRPLGNDWYPAPRDTDLYLRLWYRRKVGCLNGGYSHALEKSHEAKEIPCQMLLHQYAQVERIRLRYESATVGKSASEISFGIIQERLIMDSDFGLVTLHTLCLPVINELKIA